MKKRVLFFAVMVVMVIMIAAGCQSATAAEIEVSGEKVPSLYTALGQERKVVSTGTEATIGKTTKTVGYSGISSEDLMSYYDYLGANGYICTDESSTSIQMAREAAEDIAERIGALVVQTIGSKAVLFKRNEKEPKIKL